MKVKDCKSAHHQDTDAAWEVIWRGLRQVVRGVIGRTGMNVAALKDDACTEALTELIRHPSPLLHASGDTDLNSFLWGYLRNVVFRLRERERARTSMIGTVDVEVLPLVEIEGASKSGVATILLSPKQREAIQLLREGLSVSAIARSLGIAPSSARERLQRGWETMRRAPAHMCEKPETRQAFARSLMVSRTTKMTFANLNILFLHAQGLTHRLIADRTGLSRDAVRKRLERMRKMPHECDSGTSPPLQLIDYR